MRSIDVTGYADHLGAGPDDFSASWLRQRGEEIRLVVGMMRRVGELLFRRGNTVGKVMNLRGPRRRGAAIARRRIAALHRLADLFADEDAELGFGLVAMPVFGFDDDIQLGSWLPSGRDAS